MRQTLLGWKMVENNEYSCNEFVHLHIIPKENKELLDRVTSPKLKGNSMSDAWKNILKEKQKYLVISPNDFILPISSSQDTRSIVSYLQTRYW